MSPVAQDVVLQSLLRQAELGVLTPLQHYKQSDMGSAPGAGLFPDRLVLCVVWLSLSQRISRYTPLPVLTADVRSQVKILCFQFHLSKFSSLTSESRRSPVCSWQRLTVTCTCTTWTLRRAGSVHWPSSTGECWSPSAVDTPHRPLSPSALFPSPFLDLHTCHTIIWPPANLTQLIVELKFGWISG